MDKTKSPKWATIILFGIVSIVALLIIVSVLLVAFSPSPRMATARQRWRERAAASVCQKIMERSDCKSYGGRVMDCTGRVLACVENRYDLYFDCCATMDEKWNKSAPELAGRLANVLPYRTQNQWRAYLEDGRKLRRRYLPIAKNLGSLELMMLEGLPLMSTRSREGGESWKRAESSHTRMVMSDAGCSATIGRPLGMASASSVTTMSGFLPGRMYLLRWIPDGSRRRMLCCGMGISTLPIVMISLASAWSLGICTKGISRR